MLVDVDIDFVQPGDERFVAVESLATTVLEQDRYLRREYPHADESYVLGAFQGGAVLGFLRFLIQVIGSEERRPPVLCGGVALREAYVEAFGVAPSARRQGVGSALQQAAAKYAQSVGCYQIRSHSPVTCIENYSLKLANGYVMHPSCQTDSYYFIRKL